LSSSTPISAARAARLILRLRLARFFNQVASGFQRFRRGSANSKRTATPGKSKLGWFVGAIVALSMIFSFTNIARQAMANIKERLGSTTTTVTVAKSPVDAGAPQGWLGAQLSNLTKQDAEALGRGEARGAKVTGTVAASPAAKVGLERNDIITGLDQQDIANARDLIRIVASKAPGTSVELILWRNGKERRVPILLAARPTGAVSPQHKRLALPVAPGYALPWEVLQGALLEACVLLLATLLMALASREIAQPDWDVEWLVTFPVPLTTLLGVRILERTLVNPTGLFILWPFLSVVAWEAGYRVAAPLLGLAVTFALLAILTTIWTLCDTGLRLNLSPPKLRNLQAILSIVAVGCLYLAMSPGIAADSYLLGWAPGVPAILFWLPPGLAIGALTATQPADAGLALLALAIEVLICVALGFAVLAYQVRLGVVSVAGRESGRGISKRPPATRATTRRLPLSPIQARELKLLARDRSFLVQTLLLPVIIIGAQVLLNTPGRTFAVGLGSPEHVAAAAFAVAAYTLMFSAFQTLNSEGQALWILYTLPRSLETILREKAVLWGVVCLAYAIAVIALGLAWNPTFSLHQLELISIILLGVPIFAVISTALGVFACDPLAQLVQRRVRPSYLYLYMLLASLYVVAIYASSIWQRAGLIVLTALLGMALWQKARDHLPYLLDPDASPPARVSVADGLIAALLFFVLQALIALALSSGEPKLTGRATTIAFAVAGAATYACVRFVYWRLKTEGVPRVWGAAPMSSVVSTSAWGVLGGSLTAAAGLVYLNLIAHTQLFETAHESAFKGDELAWLALLTVCAAPIFEEFIFRGLIFGGLRRSLGLGASLLASAAIFAIVHPAASVIPVFGLGIGAALVYERTRFLLGPMLVHGVYNAAIVGYQALS
jgi:ABC-2 type transport system permease protein